MFRLAYVRKDRVQGVVVRAGYRVVLMIVAARARYGQPKKTSRNRIDAIVHSLGRTAQGIRARDSGSRAQPDAAVQRRVRDRPPVDRARIDRRAGPHSAPQSPSRDTYMTMDSALRY